MAASNKPMSGGPAKQSTTTGKPTNAPVRPQNKPGVTPAKPAKPAKPASNREGGLR